ncbi:lyase family protein [Neobacillus fumarioli]|uniref:lyase family protein n=1 Tax=Neobacillus fumarioli TaxID=105229 RepID=UPI0008346E80|nr:lyase family protein [Neobacillus fumarioli]
MRIEQDAFGTVSLPDEVLYGIQTVRTVNHMSFSGHLLSDYPAYIRAMAQVKKAAAKANKRAGVISDEICEKIQEASQQLIDGKWVEQFPIDVFHGGGSIGTNMNVNEVIARLAGDDVHPTEHVNASQSTADACHTAMRIALISMMEPFVKELDQLIKTLENHSLAFASIRTIARTCWQDGLTVPMSSLFEATASALRRRREFLHHAVELIHHINLGGTVVGSGTGAPEAYRTAIVPMLVETTGYPLRWRENLYDAAQYPDDLAQLSSEIHLISRILLKLAKDLRLLASGPEAGLNELRLPAVQAGSSFFPGKVNPVIAETMIQCSMLEAGNHYIIQSSLEMGEVHLNIWEGMMGILLMQNISMLTEAMLTFHNHCVAGIEINEVRCEEYAASFIPMVVELKERYGYQQVSKWVKEMSKEELKKKMKEEKQV